MIMIIWTLFRHDLLSKKTVFFIEKIKKYIIYISLGRASARVDGLD